MAGPQDSFGNFTPGAPGGAMASAGFGSSVKRGTGLMGAFDGNPNGNVTATGAAMIIGVGSTDGQLWMKNTTGTNNTDWFQFALILICFLAFALSASAAQPPFMRNAFTTNTGPFALSGFTTNSMISNKLAVAQVPSAASGTHFTNLNPYSIMVQSSSPTTNTPFNVGVNESLWATNVSSAFVILQPGEWTSWTNGTGTIARWKPIP